MANAVSLLPHDIVQAIQKILQLPSQSEDPLDDISHRFDPVVSLNRLFPDESSLAPSNIESVYNNLANSKNELQLDVQQFREVLASPPQEDYTGKGPLFEPQESNEQRMGAIQEVISDLLLQTSRIREKSSESSHIVHEITKDIQMLDLAKRNLVTSINSLRRFGMMVNGVSQLEDQLSASPRKYPDIAQSLAAVKNLASTFRSSSGVPRIAISLKRIQVLQGEIRSIMEREFDAFYLQDPAKAAKSKVITDACLVVDVLGKDVRNHLIDRYCSVELKEYRKIFRSTDEAGQLDNIARRFAYFRRLLATYDSDYSHIFPTEWKVGCALAVKWSELTREDFTTVLVKVASTLTVAPLLESLQQTTEFEAFLGRKFGISYSNMLTEGAPIVGVRNPKPMSSAFEPHMGVFIDAQDKALSDLLTPHRGSKSRPSVDGTQTSSTSDADNPPITVLSSSTELFYFYGQNLEQCSKLSNKGMLLDMFGVWGKWLRIYAEDVLMASMKKSEKERRSMDGGSSQADIKHASLIVNTADYCQNTAQELEEKVKEKISDEYKEKISLQAERDLFVGVISSAILVLLKELEATIEGSLLTMQRTSWVTVEAVSGESPYIGELVKGVFEVVNTVREHIEHKKYLRNFYDKAASLIVTKFTNALVKSRPLKEAGAEQILLDLQGLRSCLLKLPGLQAIEGSTYSKSVTKNTSRLETLLKLVIAPVDPPDGFVQNYILLVGDSSFSNFQKVLDMKGTPRAEQNNLLDSFLTITSTREELESTSFLSSLDMDPGSSSALLQTNISPPGSRVGLPSLSSRNDGSSASGGFGALGGSATPPTQVSEGRKEPSTRISDFKRFVSFAVRRDTSSGN